MPLLLTVIFHSYCLPAIRVDHGVAIKDAVMLVGVALNQELICWQTPVPSW